VSSPVIRTPVSGLTRRTGLVTVMVGIGALATGCTVDSDPQPAAGRGRSGAGEAAGQDPDVALVALAVAGERSALEAVTATIDRHADLADALSRLLDAHRAHVNLLADAAPDEAASGPTSPTTPASPGPGESTGSTGTPTVPARTKAALQRLSSMEQGLSLANKRHAFAAESGAFARLLASMAASAAQHASFLAEPAAPERPGR